MKMISTIFKFVIYGFVGLSAGIPLGIVTAISCGFRSPQETGPVIFASMAICLLLGLAMASTRKT